MRFPFLYLVFFIFSTGVFACTAKKIHVSDDLIKARVQLSDAMDDCPSLDIALALAATYQKLAQNSIAYEVMQDAANDFISNDNDRIKWLTASTELALKSHNICGANSYLNELHGIAHNSKNYKSLRKQLFQLENTTIIDSQTIACSLSSSRSVSTRGMKIRAKIDLAIHFAFNSAQLSAKGQQQAQQLAHALLQNNLQNKKIILIGHTDQQGTQSYNQNLSERRALAVSQFLKNVNNRLSNRISTVGKGESQPLSLGNDETDYQLNRRVEVQIL